MKTILCILLAAALALLAGLELACGGLVLVAIVLLIGDLVGQLPESPCTQNCNQGRACDCPLAAAREKPNR